MAVADGGVADEEDGGKVGVFRAYEAEADLLGARVGLRALRAGCGGWGGLSGEGEERDEAGEGCGEEGGSGAGGSCRHERLPSCAAGFGAGIVYGRRALDRVHGGMVVRKGSG